MRIITIFILLILVVPSMGCSVAEASSDRNKTARNWEELKDGWGDYLWPGQNRYLLGVSNTQSRRTITWDGLERVYYLHVPTFYRRTRPTPLVLNFHGGGSNPGLQAFVSGMIRKSNDEGFIVVHPEATGERAKRWNGGPHADRDDVDDIGFIGAMLDELERNFNIDPDRIFATGISSGGFMCYRLACEMSDRITAIAPVAAMHDFDCEPSEPVPVIHFHGTRDRYCPYSGGKGTLLDYSFESVEDTINFWVENNMCSSEYEVIRRGDVYSYTYFSDVGADVVLCRIERGGHNWPGGQPEGGRTRYFGYCTNSISATDTMWEFFKRVTGDNQD